MAPDDPKIDFPHGTILIPAVTPAEELAAAEQRNKRTGAQIIWTRPPAVESAKAAVRGMLPLQWPLTRRMDDWQAAYFAFYELGIALGPISRFKEPPMSSPNGAVKLLYGSVASAVGRLAACLSNLEPASLLTYKINNHKNTPRLDRDRHRPTA